MSGRHRGGPWWRPDVLALRLWYRFEVMPFRRGMALIGALVLVPVLAIGLLVSMGGSGGEHRKTAAVPSRTKRFDAAVRPAPTFGEYVPPRTVGPKLTAPLERPTSPHPRTTRPKASDSPSPRASCPTELRRWPPMWNMCVHQGRSGRP